MGPIEPGRSLWARALDVLPGGVSSPVRAFRAVGGEPFFTERGRGAYLYDACGRRYLDYVLSWGPLILGHAHPEVVEAVERALRNGLGFGTPVRAEVELAERVCEWMPAIEMLRFVSSGTEATMSAVRLARGATGRPLILKFEGCYHGHADAFLVQAGSGVATLGLPDSPGVPQGVSRLTVTAPFNDTDALDAAFDEHGDDLAAAIVEPIIGNAGFIPPEAGYLEALRDRTARAGALLIFDEVMTGFRVERGGAQARFGVVPDLTTLGKVLGGGLPVAAYGGRRDLMEQVAPLGPVYQAGTLSGNPVALAAGLAQLRVLERRDPYEAMEARTARLANGIVAAAHARGIPATGGSAGSMWGVFFAPGPVRDYRAARAADTVLYARFFRAALRRGVYFAPSAFEAGFLSTAHGEAEIDRTLEIVGEALDEAVAGVPEGDRARVAAGESAE